MRAAYKMVCVTQKWGPPYTMDKSSIMSVERNVIHYDCTILLVAPPACVSPFFHSLASTQSSPYSACIIIFVILSWVCTNVIFCHRLSPSYMIVLRNIYKLKIMYFFIFLFFVVILATLQYDTFGPNVQQHYGRTRFLVWRLMELIKIFLFFW